MAATTGSARFSAIFTLLERHFGQREPYKPHPPVEQALVTLLLQNGKEAPALRAISRLQRKFVDWNEVRVCDPQTLDDALGRAYAGVGRLITRTLTAIFNHAQAMNLDDIMALGPDRAEQKLTRLDSMPSRVAGELLLANLNSKKLPAGAGLLRVAARTGLVRHGPADAQARALRRLVPAVKTARTLHAFEMLAERACTAENFDCRACPAHRLCPTGVETLRRLHLEEEKARAAREAEHVRLCEKHRREKKLKARRHASKEKLKKAIQLRSRTLRIPTTKAPGRTARLRPLHPSTAHMVQASSADVKSHRRKLPRRRLKPRRRPRTPLATKR